MMQEQYQLTTKHKKILLITLIVVFILSVIVGTIIYIIDSQKTSSINILIAPSSAKVEINHKQYNSRGEYKFKPGEYTATISANGFISQDINLSLTDEQTESLYIILTPTTENKDWYEQHPEDSTIVNIISDYYSNLSLQEYRNKYPIVNILPILVVEVDQTTYDWVEYRIDYGEFENCYSDFCLKITDSTGGDRKSVV